MYIMIKIVRSINIGPIIENYVNLENGIQWTEYGHKGKQAGLQYCNCEDPWSSAVGKGYGDQTRYNNLNKFFSGTVFEDLIKEFNMFRTRLMWVYPYACYSIHKDLTPRIHIPLITNQDCYFLFRRKYTIHLNLGSVWWVDTTVEHTFINCSETPRLHIVGIVQQ